MKIALAFDNCEKKTHSEIIGLTYQTTPYVDVIKIGLELFVRYGPKAIAFCGDNEIFLDLKFYDIPNTIEKTIREVEKLHVKYTTLHASMNMETLKVASDASDKVKLLAVTKLTSSDIDCKSNIKYMLSTIEKCMKSGITGFVAPVDFVLNIKKHFPETFIVTPGIRFEKVKNDDQKKIATPEQAFQAGSDMIIMGRPIIQSRNPIKVLQKLQSFRSV